MILYQPTIEIYKYSLWKGKWVQYRLHPSTLVFDSWGKAEGYKYKYFERLRREGIKLKDGTFRFFIAELLFNE